MSELVSPDSQMDSQIISYGKKLLLDDNNILKKRLTFKLNHDQIMDGSTGLKPTGIYCLKIVENVIDYVFSKLGINLEILQYSIKTKNNPEKYEMDWHVDDYQLINKNSKEQLDGNYQSISNNETLYTPNTAPKYSVIYFHSESNNDFTDGTLEFVDNTIIKPEKGLAVFFDSKEVYKLNKITSGVGIYTLLKFY